MVRYVKVLAGNTSGSNAILSKTQFAACTESCLFLTSLAYGTVRKKRKDTNIIDP